jgi:TRAP-type mannitol/chloroaromatic compound transport system substrate-binding protein
VLRFAFALMLLVLLPSDGYAEKRIALLIGNQAYAPAIGALANPHNDVALLERTLRGLGFEVVVERDAGLAALTRAVNAYARRLREAGPDVVGLFYYSGHGAADGGTNYLIPVDVKSAEDGELWDASLQLTTVTRQLKRDAANATHFVVFDACRNVLKLKKAGSRALVQSKGFVPVSQEPGMLIAYATAEGELASDIGDGAGPYAKVLAEEIAKPGVEAVTMFRNVQRRVRVAIKQEPYLGFSSLDDVYLAGLNVVSPKPVGTPSALPQMTEAAREWSRIDKTSIAELETFVRRHQSSAEADYARARLGELKRTQTAVAVPAPSAPNQAERAKQDAEAKRPATSQPAPFRLTDARTIRLQNSFPSNTPVATPAMDELARELTTLSQGTLKVETLPAGAVAPAFQLHETVHNGLLDAAWSNPIYAYGKHRALTVFDGRVPFGLEAPAFVRWLDSAGAGLLNELYSGQLKMNLRSIPCGLIGRGGDWYKKVITNPSDIKDVKFRVVGFPIDVLKRAGGTPTILPSGELVSAMDRGLLDGASLGAPAMDLHYGFSDVSKIMHFPSWSRPVSLLELLINGTVWQGLGESGQKGVAQVCSYLMHRALENLPPDSQVIAEVGKKGVRVYSYTADVVAHFKSAADDELRELRQADPFNAKVLASYDTFR